MVVILILMMLEIAWKTTLTLKLRIRPLIIEAPNFQGRKSRTPKISSMFALTLRQILQIYYL